MGYFYKLLAAHNYRKKLDNEIDLDDKTVVSNVLKVAWPSTLEALFIALISSVDTIMVATLGHAAISAVGIVNQPRMLMLAPIIALNMAVTVMVSRRKGQNNQQGANFILRNALIISFILAIFLNLMGFIFAEPLLRFAGANQQYLTDATNYLKIISVGLIFTFFYNFYSSALRSMGDSKTPFRFLLISTIVNIL